MAVYGRFDGRNLFIYRDEKWDNFSKFEMEDIFSENGRAHVRFIEHRFDFPKNLPPVR